MTTHNRRAAARLETISLGHLMDHRFRPREDLLAPWLRQGESAMLWAAAGTGKTLLTLTIGLAVAGGGTVLGWHSPKPRKVLLVDGEMAAEDLQERVEWLINTIDGIDKEAARENLHILSRSWQKPEAEFPDLGQREGTDGRPAGQDVILRTAQAHGAELILCDNFSTLAEVADENDAAAMTPTLAFLLRLKQARIACILVHHSGKSGETYRGSSKLATTFEVILGLRPDDTVLADGAAFKMEWTKYRREPCEAVTERNVRLVKKPDGRREWQAAPTASADVRMLVAEVQTCQHKTQREVAAALGWDPSKVTRIKRQAIRDKKITQDDWEGCLSDACTADLETGQPEF